MTCPGCGAHLSAVLRAHQEGRPCPSCGLSASAASEILAVRRSQADEQMRATAEAAVLRAGKAESELRVLRYRLHCVEEALKEALAGEVPDWWE
jgi:hypothetical protein